MAELSLANVGVHTIDPGNTPPVHDVLRRQSLEMREITRKAVLEMEKAGIARKSKSSYSSPVVVVKKDR